MQKGESKAADASNWKDNEAPTNPTETCQSHESIIVVHRFAYGLFLLICNYVKIYSAPLELETPSEILLFSGFSGVLTSNRALSHAT